MADPFLDPQLVADLLAPLVTAGAADAVVVTYSTDAAVLRRLTRGNRMVFVAAIRRERDGPEGCGNGREHHEAVTIILQVREAAPDGGARAQASVFALSLAVHAALEGQIPEEPWEPLLYAGGLMLPVADDAGLIYRWGDTYLTTRPTALR